MLQQTIIYLPSIIGIATIAVFVLLRYRQSAFLYSGIFFTCVAIFLLSQYLLDAQFGNALTWFWLSTFGANFAAALFIPFIWSYPYYQSLARRWVGLISVPAIVFTLVGGTPLLVRSVTYQTSGVFFNAGPLYLVQTLLLLSYFLAGLLILVSKMLKSRRAERAQLYVLFVAFSVAIVGVMLAGLVFVDNQYWQAARPISLLTMVAIIAYGMVNHQLFDIHFFIVRASAYLATLFSITLVFIAPFVLLVSFLLGNRLNIGQFILVVLLSDALLYVLQFLRRFFDGLTARIFFRNYYDPQDVLDRLGDILVRTADLALLQSETAGVLHEAIKPTFIRYLLLLDQVSGSAALARDIDSYCRAKGVALLEVDQIDQQYHRLAVALRNREVVLAVKLHTSHEDLGYILLGHKQSGELYNERDKRLLSVAADEIAISLQNVLRFEQIQRFNVTLQDEVTTATKKLKKQNQRLEELDNIKDDFISMASHQLRTPLTSVKGYLSMVLEGDAGTLNKTQEQMLKQAFTSSQRMVFLITDLLNVSRLKTGKFVIDAVPTNLANVVEQELEQLREAAQAKNISISYDRSTDLPMLMLDEVKIRQVIMNFVDNAIYYTPEGGHISVELNDANSTVELRVTDNGIGVPKAEQHHLFTKFYRATNARKARPDGTGLGLFMAQKVVVAQGGSIIFSSKEGVGSTFGFTLSKAKLAVHVSDGDDEDEGASPVVKIPSGTAKIRTGARK